MSIKRPAHPLLVALPITAIALTIVALLAHAVTRDATWYRLALYLDVGASIVALLAALAGYVDANNLPKFTAAREAGIRYAAFEALALVFIATGGLVIYTRLSQHQWLGDVAPAVLGILGLGALAVAMFYGRAVMRLFYLGQAIVTNPIHHARRIPAPPHPRSVPTIG
ncbi:MAG TPA: DUF2231 domain-containing protein [Kofleriaceae bacterium]